LTRYSIEDEMRQPRAIRNARIAVIGLVLVALVTAHQLGAFEHLKDPASFQRALLDLGPWGYLVFLVAFAAFQPFGIPGMVFVIAASLIWPWPVAYALSMTGTMLSTSIGFVLARFVARDWVTGIIPDRFRRYDDALVRRAFLTIFVLRIFFLMQPLLHAFFGISKVRFWTHFTASLAAYAVPLLFISFFGQKVLDALRDVPIYGWVIAASAITVAALIVWVVRRRPEAEEVN
jgi:uncharacterized membrane protein YdjX (TVP38/TMEM64 family)